MRELAPGQTLDQYQLDEVIARSGMATIFAARDLETGRAVVLKVPHLQYESDIVFHDRFRREEEIGLRLHHPAIIRAFQPKEKSRVYIVQEYVPGELLRTRLKREERLPVEDAVKMIQREAGTSFDPELVQKFVAILPQILAVREKYSDTPHVGH